MAEDIKIWQIVDGDKLKEIKRGKLNLEERLEGWLEADISLISDDLIVIGRQVETEGGIIDLLCLDLNGDIVIVELKRDKTQREVTAQVFDYASCVNNFSYEDINNIAKTYFNDKTSLEEAFKIKFDVSKLPDNFNQYQKLIIVASELDEGTERIVRYLSEKNGVSINAATFQFFKDEDGKEYLGKVFLIDPKEVEQKNEKISKRSRPITLTEEGVTELARQQGVDKLYQRLANWAGEKFDRTRTTQSGISFDGKMGKSINAIFCLNLEESSVNKGIFYYLYLDRLAQYMNKDLDKINSLLPPDTEKDKAGQAGNVCWGFFKEEHEVDKFLKGMQTQ